MAIIVAGTVLSPDTSTCHFPLSFIVFASDAGNAFANVANNISVDSTLSSLTISDGPLSAILGYFLAIIANSSLLSIIFGYFLSLITGGNLLSTIFSHFLSFVANNGPLYIIFGGGLLFFVFFASF